MRTQKQKTSTPTALQVLDIKQQNDNNFDNDESELLSPSINKHI